MLRKVGESEVLNDVVGEVVEAGRMSANVGERRRNDADVNGELICAAESTSSSSYEFMTF